MENFYKQILEKYNNNEYVIKSRTNETEIKKDRYEFLAAEYMVFLWMKENNDDRWKQMIKTILLPNDLKTPNDLDITNIMTFISKGSEENLEYATDCVMSLFVDKIDYSKLSVEEDYFQLDDEETFEVKEEPKEDVFFEILEEVAIGNPPFSAPEEPKKEKKKTTKKVKPTVVETLIETKQETVEPIQESEPTVQPESECEKGPVAPWHSITIDRYVYNLIENVEDKTKYIETLILKDLFSK